MDSLSNPCGLSGDSHIVISPILIPSMMAPMIPSLFSGPGVVSNLCPTG